MANRPYFLARFPHHKTGADLIAAFQGLPRDHADRTDVERWLMINSVYGSLTWQEQCLNRWLNDEP